ncbi:MAG: hypothetical protein RI907_1649 [Pseudomonadota bacterium]|jgi:hypothetical protein
MNASIQTQSPAAPNTAHVDDLLVFSQDDHVDVHVEEPEYVRVDIELADPLKLVAACPLPGQRQLKRQFLKQGHAQGLDPAFHPARFLGAIAVSTNDLVNAHLKIDGNHSLHLAIVPKDEKGLDTDCINEVLSTLCIELPPGVVLHDAPSPDLRIIWTDETGATESQRIPGEFLHHAAA